MAPLKNDIVARFFRQLAVPAALHVHFNGAGGNIGAGKYNDGSHENRRILAERLAEGMRRADMEGRTIPGCYQDHSSYLHGSKGAAVISERGHSPARSRIFKGQNFVDGDVSILKVDGTKVTDTGKRLKLPGAPASMRGRAR